MKQLKHFFKAVVALLLLGVAASETLRLLPPEDFEQMALQNEIGESPEPVSGVSTSVSEKLASEQSPLATRNSFQNRNLATPISSNTVEESVESSDERLPAIENEELVMPSNWEVLDPKQKRCFVDYQLHLKALLANSTTDFSSAHKVNKYSLLQGCSELLN